MDVFAPACWRGCVGHVVWRGKCRGPLSIVAPPTPCAAARHATHAGHLCGTNEENAARIYSPYISCSRGVANVICERVSIALFWRRKMWACHFKYSRFHSLSWRGGTHNISHFQYLSSNNPWAIRNICAFNAGCSSIILYFFHLATNNDFFVVRMLFSYWYWVVSCFAFKTCSARVLGGCFSKENKS